MLLEHSKGDGRLRVPSKQTALGIESGIIAIRFLFKGFSLVSLLNHLIAGRFNVLLLYHDHLKSVLEYYWLWMSK